MGGRVSPPFRHGNHLSFPETGKLRCAGELWKPRKTGYRKGLLEGMVDGRKEDRSPNYRTRTLGAPGLKNER